MIKPEEVNPHNFIVEKIIYDQDGFAIALGRSEANRQRLGMRWNGGEGDDKGYPKTFGNPVWFMLPDEMKIPVLHMLDIYKPLLAQLEGEENA